MLAIGILILHVVLGLTLTAHGAQKLFGWFGRPDIAGASRFFGSLGLRPARVWALVAGIAEPGGGPPTALGFLGPAGPALILAAMVVAAIRVRRGRGFWKQAGGIEYPLLAGAGAIAQALTGVGRYAVNTALGIELHEPVSVLVALGAGVLGAILSLVTIPTLQRVRPLHPKTT